MKYFLSLLIVILLYFIGVLMFTSGFLLRRIVVNENNTCSLSADTCNSPKLFDNAVIIIIDALRYDFMKYNETLVHPLPFQNNFKHMHHLLKTQPNNGKLYRFKADPPTTTLQRLKALTTGSLPTFIDAGSNFASSAISEDNFIEQLLSSNHSITFMGDDTWTGLYPNHFNKSFSYSSFNVKDLDTVDNGVMSHIFPQMEAKDCTLLISHLLGVDHCGHTFGPFHEKMRQKLTQMDTFIQSVVEKLGERSALFVFGDHGMTRTGDHGGDSADEVDAALLIYSKKELFFADGRIEEGEAKDEVQDTAEIDQVDLVPTISLLLNIPIPYQNLGLVISGVFDSYNDHGDTEDRELRRKLALLNLLKYLNINALQVNNYIEKYIEKTGMSENLLKLNNELFRVTLKYENILRKAKHNTSSIDLAALKALRSSFQDYVLNVRKLLKKSWAQFDLIKMAAGLLLTVCALVLNIAFILNVSSLFSIKTSSFVLLAEIVFMFSVFLQMDEISAVISLSFVFFFVYYFFVTFKRGFSVCLTLSDWLHVLAWTFYICSLLSNSYLVNEAKVTQFLLKSFLFFQAILIVRSFIHPLSNSFFKHANAHRAVGLPVNWHITVIYVVAMVLSLSLLLSISEWFYSCREEQVECVDGCMVADASIATAVGVRSRLLVSVCSFSATTFLLYKWLKSRGSLKAWSVAGVVGSYVPLITTTCIIIYWCFASLLPANQTIPQLNNLIQSIYLLFILSTVLIFIFPSTLHSIIQQPTQPSFLLPDVSLLSSYNHVIPSLFNQLKASWQPPAHQQSQPTVYVYGLSTAFSSPLIILAFNTFLILALLLGPSVSSSLCLYCVIVAIFFELHAVATTAACSTDPHSLNTVSITSITTFLMITCHHFYSLSHHPTITSIQWQAAFIGIDGNNVNHVLAAIMISANTFGVQIIASFISPLLLYWPLIRGRWSKFNGADDEKPENNVNQKVNNIATNNKNKNHINKINVKNSSNAATSNATTDSKKAGGVEEAVADVEVKGEFWLREGANEVEASLFALLCKVISLLALKLVASMVCVAIHRRHLMVWKIFAPRFIYEITSFLLSTGFILFTFLFSLSTNKALDRFIKRLM